MLRYYKKTKNAVNSMKLKSPKHASLIRKGHVFLLIMDYIFFNTMI